jgi:hypothetical protein
MVIVYNSQKIEGSNNMAHEFLWLVPKRVLYARFIGRLTIDELEVFVAEQHEQLASTSEYVHFINDATQVEGMEFSLKMLQTFTRQLERPDNFGWHIDVIPQTLNRMFASLAGQFAGVRTRQFGTLPEALDFLWHNDSTLPRELREQAEAMAVVE